MQAFEMATQELVLKHEEGNLKNLEDISADYYWAQKEINQLEEDLEANLPQETMAKIRGSWYKFGCRKVLPKISFMTKGFPMVYECFWNLHHGVRYEDSLWIFKENASRKERCFFIR